MPPTIKQSVIPIIEISRSAIVEKPNNETISQLSNLVWQANVESMNFFEKNIKDSSEGRIAPDLGDSFDAMGHSVNEFISKIYAIAGENEPVIDFLKKVRDFYLEISSKIGGDAYLGVTPSEFETILKKAYAAINDQFWGILETLRQRGIDSKSTVENLLNSTSSRFDMALDDSPGAVMARKIIENNRVHIFGQGIFNREGVKIDDEVLVRGVDDDGNIIYPDELLKWVESIGQIDTFDWLIIENACIHISQKGTQGETYGINVNPITFSRPDFYEKISALFDQYGINERNIILEILEYETFLEEDCSRIDMLFGKLRKRGIRIAVDDYPSGSNTLSRIVRFKNIDIVKIDGIHVMEMFRSCSVCDSRNDCVGLMGESSSRNDAMCLKNINQDYKLETLIFSMRFLKTNYPDIVFFAERVEDEQVLDFLLSLNLIEGFQGYHFQKPKLLSASDLLRRSNNGICIATADRERSIFELIADSAIDPIVGGSTEIRPVLSSELEHYVRMVDDYSSSVIHLHSFLRKGNSLGSIRYDETAKRSLISILNFLGANKITFYTVLQEGISAKTLTLEAEVLDAVLPKDPNGSRVSKEYLNLYSLLAGSFDLDRSDFLISRRPIPGDGDDIVVKAGPNFYIGIDDSENAVYHSKDSQINLLILLVISMRESV